MRLMLSNKVVLLNSYHVTRSKSIVDLQMANTLFVIVMMTGCEGGEKSTIISIDNHTA